MLEHMVQNNEQYLNNINLSVLNSPKENLLIYTLIDRFIDKRCNKCNQLMFMPKLNSNPLHCRKTHIVLAGTHRTPYTAGKPTLSSLEPTEPPTQPENPYCRRSNPTEPTLSWLEENPTYTVATRVLKHSSVLKGQSFLREAPLTCVCCWVLLIKRCCGSALIISLKPRTQPIGGANPKRIDNHLNTTKESLVKNFNAFGATLTEDETKKLSGSFCGSDREKESSSERRSRAICE
ncbi:hypothetical protein JHK82_027533 [Glycine max]|nr:hypothetical protein JHK82_027533 [Glycine max]